ncbi:metal-dependent hydrolase [uncultured Desulfuromusa sp.]|uniref:metal-dependent hydrolase n=1 Tax=uncultured Desulfuromusa sp. TaxID=219183 RepID=UPI002AA8C422|nr:metal-dependent hydrolase [uncultured Desulfuromusa sp.]
MPNGNTHRLIAVLAVGGASLVEESYEGEVTEMPLVNAAIAVLSTNLPDMIEPAKNPHHRQFFHSVAFGSLVAVAGVKLYQWQPEENWENVLRKILLVGCGGYLIHLVADSFTTRGLPWLGKV